MFPIKNTPRPRLILDFYMPLKTISKLLQMIDKRICTKAHSKICEFPVHKILLLLVTRNQLFSFYYLCVKFISLDISFLLL